jgi:ABC-type phosphate/phosphonate transport system substrate-binding protein
MRSLYIVATMAIVLAAVGGAAVRDEPIRVVLTRKTYTMEQPEDVIAAAREIADDLGRRVGRTVLVQEARSNELKHLAEDLANGSVHIVVSDALDYVRLKRGAPERQGGYPALDVRPMAVPVFPPDMPDQKPGPGYTRAVVITRRGLDAGGTSKLTFGDLRGKRFVFCAATEDDLSMVQLAALVREQGCAATSEFFSSIERVECDDACLLYVLNGQADVTCFPESVLQAKTLVAGPKFLELLNADFVVSDPYPASLVFYLQGQLREDVVQDITRELLHVHERPATAQACDQINVRRFVAIGPEEERKMTATVTSLLERSHSSPAGASH